MFRGHRKVCFPQRVGVKTSLMTMTLCSEITLVLINKSIGNKASSNLLFGEEFMFDIVINRAQL